MKQNQIITEKQFQPQSAHPLPPVVKFVNFSNEPFTWTLNKIPYTFLPSNGEDGNERYMERNVAIHFAKHLVNRELLKRGRENDTSPKNQLENPFFMELWNRIILPAEDIDDNADETKVQQEIVDRQMKAKLGKGKPVAKKGGKAAPVKVPTAEEVAAMTGQHVRKGADKTITKAASKDDEDFELLEGPDDDDEA